MCNRDDRRQYVLAPRDLAAAHFRSASVIEENIDRLTKNDFQRLSEHGAMFISSAILRAFSIELALKSLLYLEDLTLKKGHNLGELFNLQSPQSQAEIATKINAKAQREVTAIIPDVARVFEDWRYIHEKMVLGGNADLDPGELKIVAQSVLELLDERIAATSP